jgi:hypothetical protein
MERRAVPNAFREYIAGKGCSRRAEAPFCTEYLYFAGRRALQAGILPLDGTEERDFAFARPVP